MSDTKGMKEKWCIKNCAKRKLPVLHPKSGMGTGRSYGWWKSMITLVCLFLLTVSDFFFSFFLLNAIGVLFFKIPKRTGIFLNDVFMVSRVTTTSSCPREEM